MGALHAGHLELIRRAKERGGPVVVSIFVNPLQFNDPADLKRYPKALDDDLVACKNAGVDVVFTPNEDELFPHGFLTTVAVSHLGSKLEGASRPGHFRGVCTVVAKLFNIVQPSAAFFGHKDAQQLVIIEHMVRDLNMDIEVVGVPTVRTRQGLALSSRNAQLNQEQKRQALCLSRALKRVHFLVKRQGIVHSGELLQAVRSAINSAGNEVEMDYARIVSRATLEDVPNVERGNTLVLVAAKVGGVRLIDNTRL
jgi:pantoate--beta-alanine ligase